MAQAQPLTLTHQQPCAVVSLVNTSLAWSDRLRSLQLLLPDCIHISCCSPIVSALAAASQLQTPAVFICYHAHALKCINKYGGRMSLL